MYTFPRATRGETLNKYFFLYLSMLRYWYNYEFGYISVGYRMIAQAIVTS
jgi:hypothetical protein